MMGKPRSSSSVLTLALALSRLLLSCEQGKDSRHAGLVAFEDLIADPQQHAGQILCTEGVQVDGFEVSGLAASTYIRDGHRYPVSYTHLRAHETS